MTAPLFLSEPGALAGVRPGSRLTLSGPEGRHAAAVRRLSAGEAVLVGDGRGVVASGVVAETRPAELDVVVGSVLVEVAPASRFVLVQALVKDGRDERAVEQATELGVDEILAWPAARSVVVWRGDRAARSLRGWEQAVRAAAKQARRAFVPAVGGQVSTAEVASRLGAAALALVLHEEATLPLAAVALPEAGDVVLVVGPEGGVAPEELSRFEQAGALPVRLGRTVLRSSTAGPAALAVLSAMRRWL